MRFWRCPVNRRSFLKHAAAAGAVCMLPHAVDVLFQSGEAANPVDLAVVNGLSPEQITRAAVDALGGMERFVGRGDIVVVKPNMAWDRLPEQAANTNPDVVWTVVKMCFEAGAKRVKVFDRPVNDPRRCYTQSGIAEAARRAGGDVFYAEERKFREMRIKGDTLGSWPLYTDVFEADAVINVPIAKHHGLAKLTMAMKNWMGIMGGSRNRIHQRLDECIVDLAMTVRPALTVLDAVRVLTANGPQGGNLRDVKTLNTVIAGRDQVAVDSYGATLFGMQGNSLGYVVIGERNGLGTMNLAKLNIRKISI